MIINFDQSIKIISQTTQFIINGPNGEVKVYLGPRYISHGENYLEINEKLITKQNIRLLKHLNNGLITGYRKRLYQSGVWTIMKKINNIMAFKLGFSHITNFKIPDNVLIRSRSRAQFRTIDIYSLSYQLVADTAAQLLKLRKADVYRLNGFRYAQSRIQLKVGKKK